MNYTGKIKTIAPRKFYVKYKVSKISRKNYKIEIEYFVYRGNVLADSKVKCTKTISCSGKNLEKTVQGIENNIFRTERAFCAEFDRIGANKITSDFLMRQNMR